MTVTFNSITLPLASKIDAKVDHFSASWTFLCTENAAPSSGQYPPGLTALLALVGPTTNTRLASGYTRVTTLTGGQMASLAINGVTYTNCVISEPIQIAELLAPNVWKYTIKFIQQTYTG